MEIDSTNNSTECFDLNEENSGREKNIYQIGSVKFINIRNSFVYGGLLF